MSVWRKRIAYAFAAICLIGAGLLVAWVISCHTAAHTEPDPTGTLEVSDEADGFPAVDWEYWQAVNPDVIGWITVPGTTIGYPIVQAPAASPTYYLTHDIYRHRNYVGVPYLDAGCEEGLESDNACIFAHHIKHGEPMFAPIANYSNAAWAAEHAEILIQTPTSKRKLAVQAAGRISGSSKTKRTMFNGRLDFAEWYAERLSEATVRMDGAQAIRVTTLVTCSYGSRNERTVAYAADPKDIPHAQARSTNASNGANEDETQ